MKIYLILLLTLLLSLLACDTDPLMDTEPQDPVPTNDVLEENIFSCRQFEEMAVDEGFFVNAPVHLETLASYFVYGGTEHLVVREGFGGPILRKVALKTQGLQRYEDKLLICAEEGVFQLTRAGEIDTLSDARCNSITLDERGRLLLQGSFGPGNESSSYDIQEYKNNTFTPFARVGPYFNCVSLDLIGSAGQGLYAVSCNDDLAYYEDGVLQAYYQLTDAPFSSNQNTGFPLTWVAEEEGLIVIYQSSFNFFQMHRFSEGEWTTLYDLAYDNSQVALSKEWSAMSIRYNPFIQGDYLYTFGTLATDVIVRYQISGNNERTFDDVDLLRIPGIPSRQIRGIVTASDGHTYVVVDRERIVRISC